MNSGASRFLTLMAITITTLAIFACTHPRVFVGTGTLMGIEATPGDPNEGQTPAVTFGYRRAEVALVPIEDEDTKARGKLHRGGTTTKDAASTLATFNLAHNWFGPARIEQYVATGIAAKEIIEGGQYALALVGYEKGSDDLADQFADAYKRAHQEDANDDDRACWKSVEAWMDTNFPDLPHTYILTRGFGKQRQNLVNDDKVKKGCTLTTPA
ncbi:MAG: hypothetical protein IPM58_01320 [Nitrospira sp.]|nr:hypothetical protein [Nitrospira sp.]